VHECVLGRAAGRLASVILSGGRKGSGLEERNGGTIVRFHFEGNYELATCVAEILERCDFGIEIWIVWTRRACFNFHYEIGD